MKILMAIPTWNRGDYLDKAIGAVVAAREVAEGCEVELFISDNCSDDTTRDVCERWAEGRPWITCRRFDTHVADWDQVVRRLFSHAPSDYDYMWIQGDDDIITDPSAFTQIAAAWAESEPKPAVMHCCHGRRAYPGDRRVFGAQLGDLVNEIGWIELLGWISALVLSRETVTRVLASNHWEFAASSSFTHSELILEAAYGEHALVLGAGFIEPQDEGQTADCVARWTAAQVGRRYWMVVPNLLRLQANGLFTRPLSIAFFRYHTYSLWDRFATETIDAASHLGVSDEIIECKLGLIGQFAPLLGLGQERKLFEDWFDAYTDEVWEVRRALRKVSARLQRAQRPAYLWQLLPTAPE